MSLPLFKTDLLHQAYCYATGYDLPASNPVFQRYWFEAAKAGITPEDVTLLVSHLNSRIKAGVRNRECLKIRNLFGSDEAIADSIQEIQEAKAKLRKKTFPAGKVEVLASTGRPTAPEDPKPRHISEVMEAVRKIHN